MTCMEQRALHIAAWAYIALEGADHLQAHGRKRDAKGLRRAVKALLELSEQEVGADTLGRAMALTLAATSEPEGRPS